ncbi:MAG TPA: hypothetical protein VGK59_22530 [Ohtaekwangia sp.]
MKSSASILIIGCLILLAQFIIFRDYLFPIQWGQIKVSGLACTCPDEKVLNGQWYLRSITPDSLKKYDLDYSEIYVTEKPTTEFDLMGVGDYIITGQVVGKDRVSEVDQWNPLVKVEEWKEIDLITNWVIKLLFLGQVIILITIIRRRSKNRAKLK